MTVKYLHEFLVELLSLDRGVQRQLRKKLDEMHRTSLDQFSHEPLAGDQFKGLFKFRVGDWRLIYKVADGEVLFVTLGHRSDVYK